MLITRHLQFSLPYRALFSHVLRPETMNRLLDALAALIVRMHLTGFSWGDCSLSNTLFRRDAGAFAAYLVDAETGNLYPKLSEGQRSEDIEILRLNIFGECLDLQAAELLHEAIDPEAVVDDIVARYERLWHEVTYEQEVPRDARHDIEGRIRRLNELGFDVAEVAMSTVDGGYRVRPKVVDAGYHTRRLLRLTGLDAEENQARQLLNDLDAYRAESDLTDEQQAAHRWLTEVFEPVVRAVPANLRRKLEPQEIFSQIIQHKWLLSEQAGRDVGMAPAVQSYLTDVLVHRPDEQAVLGVEVPPSLAGARRGSGSALAAGGVRLLEQARAGRPAGPPPRPGRRPPAPGADPATSPPTRTRRRTCRSPVRSTACRPGPAAHRPAASRAAPAPPRPAARAGRPGW